LAEHNIRFSASLVHEASRPRLQASDRRVLAKAEEQSPVNRADGIQYLILVNPA
jgi:hypothetical protein